MHYIELNERLTPPTRDPQPDDPPILRMMPLGDIDVAEFVQNFELPVAVLDQLHDDHDEYNVRSVWKFVVKRRALCIEGGVAGGTAGAYRVGLYLLIMGKFIYDEEERLRSADHANYRMRWEYPDGINLNAIITTLIDEIKCSRRPNSRPQVSAQPETQRWSPTSLVFLREGASSSVRLDWPHGIWGTDLMGGSRSMGALHAHTQHSSSDTPTERGPTDDHISKEASPSEAQIVGDTVAVQESLITQTATRSEVTGEQEVIQVEDSDEDDLYADFPELAGTKREVIPNPFLPRVLERPEGAGRNEMMRPYTVQTTTAALPPVTEDNRRRSLSLNDGSRPGDTAFEGLGLTVDPPADERNALGHPINSSTPNPRGRALVRDLTHTTEPESASQMQLDKPSVERTAVARKRPVPKPAPASSSDHPKASSAAVPTTSRVAEPSKSPAIVGSELCVAPPARGHPTAAEAPTRPDDQLASSMLGAFAQSSQGGSRINYVSEPRAVAANTTRRKLKRNIKRPHGSSEEEVLQKKPDPKKSRSGSRHSQGA
ncbi:hypothetical protein RSAG8_09609, partial [Rhizoctonia solani AG-8 WAC10335]